MHKCRKCGKELEEWEEREFINKCRNCYEEYIKWLSEKSPITYKDLIKSNIFDSR